VVGDVKLGASLGCWVGWSWLGWLAGLGVVEGCCDGELQERWLSGLI
jgi:prepilin signal peptidase PulO-like enzyme (type II secretory pathway)